MARNFDRKPAELQVRTAVLTVDNALNIPVWDTVE